ncbi:hypothetical protein FUA26_14810 [Seonamhaeicola algicola]|uniref:Carboxypeptidase regulatory-like domain-containing protein n=1 Tax=Seonamhaeicola algicola TaxID=1719036 RepID=A0A5C7ACQ9_9FLAO|nr:hypothetical protein [Seonamhaeicola algicola]TXE06241.1 hypothetical protein FUA26_14810 [Seonamhaeicola algicola]
MFCLCYITTIAQNNKLAIESRMVNEIPNEEISVVINTNVLLAGETLNYKLFCLVNKHNALSSLSKVAYVELYSSKNNSIFSHKIKLEKGMGSGDFFVSPTVETGHYKLITYTQWMKNSDNQFSETDIYIINPFNNSSFIGLNSNKTKLGLLANSHLNNKKSDVLKLDAQTYATRKKVTLKVTDLIGNFTLSVRKANNISIEASEVNSKSKRIFANSKGFVLPEIRGEIISGVVYDNLGNTAANKKIALSIPGENYIYKNVVTDSLGNFLFNIHENYLNTQVYFQVIGDSLLNYSFKIHNKNASKPKDLIFKNLQFNAELKDWIITQSINNQIENAYHISKADSIKPVVANHNFLAEKSVVYKLDDYTRFKTIKETFIEVVEGAALRKKEDNYIFKIYHNEGNNHPFSEYKPLLLLDGVLIQDEKFIVDYDPYKIEEIGLIKGAYFYGPKIYYGVIDIKTKSGNAFVDGFEIEGLTNYTLKLIQPQKKYFSPNYDENSTELKRIPDFRSQLLWCPNVKLNGEEKTITFFTSDVKGVFEVILSGYNMYGRYISEKTYFTVE